MYKLRELERKDLNVINKWRQIVVMQYAAL